MTRVTAQAVAVLAAAYPRASMPDETVRVYVVMLADLPAEPLGEAINRLIRRSTFLPSISEIRREVAEAELDMPSVAQAYSWILLGSEQRTSLGIPRVSEWHPALRAALTACGGSWAFRTSDRPEMLRAQFERHYGDRREEAIVRAMGAHPGGKLELDSGLTEIEA